MRAMVSQLTGRSSHARRGDRIHNNFAPLGTNVRFSIAASVKLALIYSCSHPFALRLIMPHGALASLRGRRQPPHDGMRRMGRYNLRGALTAGQRQDRRTLRTRPTRRPREDIFLPKQNRYLLACSFPAFSAGSSGNRRNRGAVLAPAELAAIDPHPVQNHGQAPGDRDDGPTYPTPLSHPHAPRL